MPSNPPARPMTRWLFTLLAAVGVLLLLATASAQQNGRRTTTGGDFVFRAESTLDSLVADNTSTTTLVAFLSTGDGSAIEGERIRFILQDGNAFLGEGDDVAVNATDVGNGIYIANLRAGTVEGPVSISAVWVSSPFSPLPREEISVDLVTAETLSVEVEDPVVLADGQDESTIVAYLLDGLGRPVDNADVTFRLVRGTGQLVTQMIEGRNGRYAAIYRPSTTPGQAIVEVSLPTNTRTLRDQVTIDVVETATMEAVAFPERVARRLGNSPVLVANTSTILVPVRDGDGDLVRGLTNAELVAQVIEGPGQVVGPVEILLGGQNRSGIYKFTFVAGETTGTSTVRILNLESPTQASADVTIETVTEVNPSRTEQVEIVHYADDPFYADGASQALIVMFAADRSGNAVPDLDEELEVIITDGQGVITDVNETPNLAGNFGTGVYLATFTAGTGGIDTQSQIRATFLNPDGTLQEQEITLEMEPLGAPRIVVFPPRLPASREAIATVDIYDFDSRGLDELNLAGLAAASAAVRYRVDIQSGPGRITVPVGNDGNNLDLNPDDNVSTAVFAVDGSAGAEQEIVLDVIDLAAAGYPQQEASVELGQTVTLRATTQPTVLDQGDIIEIIAFAQDEFGLPAIDHDLRLTVVSGSAQVLNGGRMVDNGLGVEDFTDPVAGDGMYVGVVRATGTTGGTVTVRITDLTSPNLPEVELQLDVRE